MQHSDSVTKIATALAKVAAEIENPTKNAENPHFRNRYADLAEIINTSRVLLAQHGLAVVQCPGMDDLGRVTVESMLVHESGEWIKGTARSPIPKADPQGVGSATTYLRRYSLAALLGLAQEDDDAETASQKRDPHTGEKHQASPVRKLTGEEPKGRTPNGNGADPLAAPCPGNKHKGKTCRQVLESDPKYCEWALGNMDRLPFDVRDALHAALHMKPEPVKVPLSQPEPDDLPF